MQLTHKLIISYIGIILITSLLWMYFQKQELIQEGAKFKIGKKGSDPFAALKEIPKKIKEVEKFFKKMSKMVKNLKTGFTRLGGAIKKLNSAIKFGFVRGASDIKNIGDTTTNVAGKFLINLWISTVSFWNCFIKIMKNIPSCFGIYSIHGIGYLLYYLSIGLPVYLIDLFTAGFVNLQPTIDMIFELFFDMSTSMFGDHINSIYKKCYYCNITPMPFVSPEPIKQAFQKTKRDFKYVIPDKFNQANTKFVQAGNQIKSVFTGKK
jgi:hypothetical protein